MMSNDELFRVANAWVSVNYPGSRLELISLCLDDQAKIKLPLPRTVPKAKEKAKERPRCSADFTSVNWYGEEYHFTTLQAAAVKVLWEAWEDDTPDVRQDALLEAIDSDGNRLRDIFRNHPAWDTMIVSTSKGFFRLNDSP